jgi:hypothetical protein
MSAVTLEEFQAYVGTEETGDFVESCLSAGNAHVGRYIGESEEVPNEIHRQAILICASELFHRRSAPQGVAQFASLDGSPVRVARDPMIAVYPLLQPYVGYGV